MKIRIDIGFGEPVLNHGLLLHRDSDKNHNKVSGAWASYWMLTGLESLVGGCSRKCCR